MTLAVEWRQYSPSSFKFLEEGAFVSLPTTVFLAARTVPDLSWAYENNGSICHAVLLLTNVNSKA